MIARDLSLKLAGQFLTKLLSMAGHKICEVKKGWGCPQNINMFVYIVNNHFLKSKDHHFTVQVIVPIQQLGQEFYCISCW